MAIFALVSFSATDNVNSVVTAFGTYKAFGPFMFAQIFNAIAFCVELPPELFDFGY